MNLKTLRLLKHNDAPLIITVEKQGERHALITRDEVTVEEEKQDIFKYLKKILAFYPEGVWINGEEMETSQWPGLARVEILEPDKDGWERNSNRGVALGAPAPASGFNAIVGGVMTWVSLTDQQRRETKTQYFTPQEDSARKHHVPLQLVTLAAFMEIKAREIEQMENPDGKSHLTIPKGSDLEATVMARAQEMIERTRGQEELPKPYGGKAYARPMTGSWGAEHFTAPYPIGVMGTPILLEDDCDTFDNAEFTTIVENLYGSDAKLLPVLEGPTRLMGDMSIPEAGNEALKVEDVTFEIEDHPDCAMWAKSITMVVELKDRVFRHPCSFHIQGAFEECAEVKFIPGEIDEKRMTDMLFQAFWLQTEWGSWDDVKYERDELNDRMRTLAMHTMGNTKDAVTQELQRTLDRFHSIVPLPEGERISVTSQDGRLKLTLNP